VDRLIKTWAVERTKYSGSSPKLLPQASPVLASLDSSASVVSIEEMDVSPQPTEEQSLGISEKDKISTAPFGIQVHGWISLIVDY
jgi:hypothetical protein